LRARSTRPLTGLGSPNEFRCFMPDGLSSAPLPLDAAVASGEPPLPSAALNGVASTDPLASISLAKPTSVRYTVLAWACSLSMLTYIDRVCIKNVRGDMQNSLGIDESDFGLVFGAFGLAYAAFEVPSGWLGDRFGPRIVLTRIVLWW